MALTKQRKSELIAQYTGWLKDSSAVVMAQFPGISAKELYGLRVKLRETRGELHVVKLTLFARALKDAGKPMAESLLTGTLIMAFARNDPAAVAKMIVNFANDVKEFQIRGSLLGDQWIDADGVKALADLPPRPVILSGLVGTLQGPLSQLVSVLNAPLREIAQVLKARSEQEQAQPAVA